MNNKLRMGFASALVTVLMVSTSISDQVSAAALQPGDTGTTVTASAIQPGDTGMAASASALQPTETAAAVLPVAAAANVSVNANINNESSLGVQVNGSDEIAQADLWNAQISAFMDIAQQQLGKSYVYGSVGPSSFDCSGLVYYCLSQMGVSIDRTSAAGFSKISEWEKITSMDDLKIGDILFFRNGGKSIRHAAIYIGNGNMIDASTSEGQVVQRSCTTSYWLKNFVFARRVF